MHAGDLFLFDQRETVDQRQYDLAHLSQNRQRKKITFSHDPQTMRLVHVLVARHLRGHDQDLIALERSTEIEIITGLTAQDGRKIIHNKK